jgi:predicted unusual protein kinase regulating ubiquinone biosynthesis (AarF/ABC1/UbiB family)
VLEAGERRRQRVVSLTDSLGYLDDLIAVLSRLGPVFSHLGRYLGSRPDSFRPEHCLHLRQTGSVSMLSAEALQPYFADFFPEAMPPWILNLREDAGRSDHLIHVYRWRTQREISFRLVNPKFAEAWPADRLTLPFVEHPARKLWPAAPFGQIISQFERCVERGLDLEREIQCLAYFESHQQQPAAAHPRFVLPQIADEFCCPGMVAIREPSLAVGSHPLHEQKYEDETGESSKPTPAQLDVTRLLCLTWLHHALKFSWFPESPAVANVAVTATRQIACLGGSIASLDREIQDVLFQYLGAVASNRPDEAAELLLTVFRRRKNATDFETVRDRFRQLVAFRDGGWGRIGQQESFAEYVLIQWRIATESGYEAPEGLVPFVRSFWEIAAISHAVAPQRDVLRDTLDEFRWIVAFDKLRGLFTPANLASHGQEWINLMMEMPEKLNTIASHTRSQEAAGETFAKGSAPKNQWPAVLAHAFVLGSITLLLVKLAEVGVVGEWFYALGFVAILAVVYSLLTLFKGGP